MNTAIEATDARHEPPGTRIEPPVSPYVRWWLVAGLVMIFVQVFIGGITRLTGSGLSITKWEIVTGTIPPLNAQQWETAFDQYKQTPQYQKINQGMSMSDFKFIFFWEYFHRLWARSLGFVFLIPFVIFWRRRMLPPWLMRRLGVVVLLGGVVGVFGWIMVASGLVDRPWVNAYKLTLHLSLAFVVYTYLLWTTFRAFQPERAQHLWPGLRRHGIAIACIAAVQIVLGGLMSGMKAGLFYPTFPDMQGAWIPAMLFDAGQWHVDNFANYDKNPFMPALVQILHRSTAYLLTIMVLYYFFQLWRKGVQGGLRTAANLLVIMLVTQVLLGIITLINCIGTIPVTWGVLHQAGAVLLLTAALLVVYRQGRLAD